MFKELWFRLVIAFKSLFVTPEYTKLEQELMRQNANLQNQLNYTQEKLDSYIERTLFPRTNPAPETVDFTPIPGQHSWKNRRSELEELSKKRAQEAIDRLEKDLGEKGIKVPAAKVNTKDTANAV